MGIEIFRPEVNFNMGGRLELKNGWVIDSGATSHMSNDEMWFHEMVKFNVPRKCSAGDGYALKV